jgi:hypothetical protein
MEIENKWVSKNPCVENEEEREVEENATVRGKRAWDRDTVSVRLYLRVCKYKL